MASVRGVRARARHAHGRCTWRGNNNRGGGKTKKRNPNPLDKINGRFAFTRRGARGASWALPARGGGARGPPDPTPPTSSDLLPPPTMGRNFLGTNFLHNPPLPLPKRSISFFRHPSEQMGAHAPTAPRTRTHARSHPPVGPRGGGLLPPGCGARAPRHPHPPMGPPTAARAPNLFPPPPPFFGVASWHPLLWTKKRWQSATRGAPDFPIVCCGLLVLFPVRLAAFSGATAPCLWPSLHRRHPQRLANASTRRAQRTHACARCTTRTACHTPGQRCSWGLLSSAAMAPPPPMEGRPWGLPGSARGASPKRGRGRGASLPRRATLHPPTHHRPCLPTPN